MTNAQGEAGRGMARLRLGIETWAFVGHRGLVISACGVVNLALQSATMASILIIGPHPDDQELGMGGTIIRLAAQGHKVHIVDMTNGEPTPRGSVETRAKESAAAAKVMGVGRTLLGLTNREVVHDLQSRHKLAA